MANLRFTAISSLDGSRAVGTYLYGRRMYEVMTVWETDPSFTQESSLLRDYAAIWQAAAKIVYSATLDEVVTQRTRLVRAFDAEDVRRLKASASADLTVAGPMLAAAAFDADLG